MNYEDGQKDKERIQGLNDILRTSFTGGRVVMTQGVNALGDIGISDLVKKVQSFPLSKFTSENDPYGEHDFGSINYEGTKYFWKIDYYDPKLECHSENPADPSQTRRVLTIMRADEY